MIELNSVVKSFGSLAILEQFSHTFASGSKTAVTGPSGIGKTTLLNVIAGLVPISAGLIKIDGTVTDTPTARVHPSRRNLGFAFQFPSLWPHMSVRDNILYGLAGFNPQEREKRFDTIIESLVIKDLIRKYPGELSGGQAKRVALARTMVVKPRHLLLDEPLNNLDCELKDRILEAVMDYAKENTSTVIFVTHDPAEAEDVCDVVCRFSSHGMTRV